MGVLDCPHANHSKFWDTARSWKMEEKPTGAGEQSGQMLSSFQEIGLSRYYFLVR
jgi:hypothetical protein